VKGLHVRKGSASSFYFGFANYGGGELSLRWFLTEVSYSIFVRMTVAPSPHPSTRTYTNLFVCLFLALRGPPLDENLLLSNIETSNKKVEHLTEVGNN